jgi:hypothetical protein
LIRKASRSLKFLLTNITIIAIIPPDKKEKTREYNTNFTPMMAPIAQKSLMSPAPSILSAYRNNNISMGRTQPIRESRKPRAPFMHKLKTSPPRIKGNVIVFGIFFVLISRTNEKRIRITTVEYFIINTILHTPI